MYGSTEGVRSLVPALGDFSDRSTPDEYQVTTWLEEASAWLDAALASGGYAAPTSTSIAGYKILVGLAQLYAAANALQARGIDTFTGTDENSSERMFARFFSQLKMLSAGNLEALGLTLLVGILPRPRTRTRQLRRIDGYSGTYGGSTLEYDYPSE